MNMDIKKWNPVNWFKHEEKEDERARHSGYIPAIFERKGRNSGEVFAPSGNPLLDIHREIDRVFENVFSNALAGRLPSLSGGGNDAEGLLSNVILRPNVDIKERKNDYQITVEIPGVEEDDISLEVADGALIVSGEKKHEKEEDNEHYHSIERSYGAFRRILSLPEDVDENAINAEFKNGVLTISVARKELEKPQKNVKQIEIKKAA